MEYESGLYFMHKHICTLFNFSSLSIFTLTPKYFSIPYFVISCLTFLLPLTNSSFVIPLPCNLRRNRRHSGTQTPHHCKPYTADLSPSLPWLLWAYVTQELKQATKHEELITFYWNTFCQSQQKSLSNPWKQYREWILPYYHPHPLDHCRHANSISLFT